MIDDNAYNNLISLFKLFKNRPYHLAKYLIDNSAFDDKFIDIIKNSKKLNSDNMEEEPYFKSIKDMDNYYQSILETNDTDIKSDEQIESDLNYKLNNLISDEKFEDAARLRDYMKKKNINRTKN